MIHDYLGDKSERAPKKFGNLGYIGMGKKVGTSWYHSRAVGGYHGDYQAGYPVSA
jgi:hypothetical protein